MGISILPANLNASPETYPGLSKEERWAALSNAFSALGAGLLSAPPGQLAQGFGQGGAGFTRALNEAQARSREAHRQGMLDQLGARQLEAQIESTEANTERTRLAVEGERTERESRRRDLESERAALKAMASMAPGFTGPAGEPLFSEKDLQVLDLYAAGGQKDHGRFWNLVDRRLAESDAPRETRLEIDALRKRIEAGVLADPSRAQDLQEESLRQGAADRAFLRQQQIEERQRRSLEQRSGELYEILLNRERTRAIAEAAGSPEGQALLAQEGGRERVWAGIDPLALQGRARRLAMEEMGLAPRPGSPGPGPGEGGPEVARDHSGIITSFSRTSPEIATRVTRLRESGWTDQAIADALLDLARQQGLPEIDLGNGITLPLR